MSERHECEAMKESQKEFESYLQSFWLEKRGDRIYLAFTLYEQEIWEDDDNEQLLGEIRIGNICIWCGEELD